MGQKTHPKAFRLVTTQKHLSEWYTNKFSYPKLIEEDYFIREKTNKYFANFLTISKIEVTRICFLTKRITRLKTIIKMPVCVVKRQKKLIKYTIANFVLLIVIP